eukprot:1276435-Rhodomonas_salina.1
MSATTIADLNSQRTLSAAEVWGAIKLTETTPDFRMRKPPDGQPGDRSKGDLPADFHVAQTARSFLAAARK